MDKDIILQEKEAEVRYFKHYTTLGLESIFFTDHPPCWPGFLKEWFLIAYLLSCQESDEKINTTVICSLNMRLKPADS